MKQEEDVLRLSKMTLKSTPYEYKLRRYKTRRIQKEESDTKDIEDLEAFTSYSTKKPDEKEGVHTHNIVLRRHIRKKKLEYMIRKNVVEAETETSKDKQVEKDARAEKEEVSQYMIEVKPVKEEKEKTMYTFDVVQWEKSIDIQGPQGNIESRLLLDQDFDIVKWEESIVYDDRVFTTDRINTHLVIDANDKNLLFDIVDREQSKEKKQKKKKSSIRALGGKYNISGDKAYVRER